VERADLVAVLHALVSFASQGHRGAPVDAQLPATIVDAALRLSG
jgi:hypothetical protein